MRDLLIRYLLGELDEHEQLQLEEQLRQSPELRRELAYLQTCFSAASDANQAAQPDLPPGLAARTTERVTSSAGDAAESSPDEDGQGWRSRRPAALAAAVEPPAAPVSWSFADVTVAAGVFLAVSMLLLPALRGSREIARQNVCADILSQLGFVTMKYAEGHHGEPPRVEANDYTGMFIVKLVEGGVVDREHMATLVICPASQQADEVFAGPCKTRIPTLVELQLLRGGDEEYAKQLFDWSFAYPVGYQEGPEYKCRGDICRSRLPLAADAPQRNFDAANPKCANHNGQRLNVLWADCHDKAMKTCELARMSDHLFLNEHGEAKPGCHSNDIVLLRPDVSPGGNVVRTTH